MNPFLPDDLLFRHSKDPYLGGQNHIPVFQHVIAGRAKAVPVQNRSQQVAVGKYNGSRAVQGSIMVA